ncbi:helix-turn-helix domain-containing protein [Bacillus solitudinis]|uniref:helix-turn-helix domain-containing protein n=2 Tax=Bacillus solitudinis TaxID=2014074 RepID=UPI0018E20F18|nr:AraC family transcriptional regulator [Bacillus solitudinis]
MLNSQVKSVTCTRYVDNIKKNGIVSCGFLQRNHDPSFRNIHNKHYSCFVLIHGYGSLIDETGKEYSLSPNSFCQLFPGNKYTILIEPSEPWYEFQLSMDKDIVHALASLNLLNIKKTVFEINVKPYLEQWFNDLLFQLESSNNQSDLTEVFFNAQKLLICLHNENSEIPDTDVNTIISGAKQILCLDYDKAISLEDVAASFNMSYENLRKLFKKMVGLSPIQYRLNAKFHYAERLLNEGNSVKSVASHVGYEDPCIFSRQFKKYMGRTPNSFKKNATAKKSSP